MKKMKCLLFICLTCSLVLLTGMNATAQQTQRERPENAPSLESLQIEQKLGQRIKAKLENQSSEERLAAAKAKQQQRAANKDTKPNQANEKLSGKNVSAKTKARKENATATRTVKIRTFEDVQLNTVTPDKTKTQQRRQAKVAELRKKASEQSKTKQHENQ